MRDPERIPEVLASIERIWKEYPDLRLGQLLINSIDLPYAASGLFYIEDDKLVSLIEEKFGE